MGALYVRSEPVVTVPASALGGRLASAWPSAMARAWPRVAAAEQPVIARLAASEMLPLLAGLKISLDGVSVTIPKPERRRLARRLGAVVERLLARRLGRWLGHHPLLSPAVARLILRAGVQSLTGTPVVVSVFGIPIRVRVVVQDR